MKYQLNRTHTRAHNTTYCRMIYAMLYILQAYWNTLYIKYFGAHILAFDHCCHVILPSYNHEYKDSICQPLEWPCYPLRFSLPFTYVLLWWSDHSATTLPIYEVIVIHVFLNSCRPTSACGLHSGSLASTNISHLAPVPVQSLPVLPVCGVFSAVSRTYTVYPMWDRLQPPPRRPSPG